MQKVKLAIWGITESIWNSITGSIDPRKSEIICFFDNNQGLRGGAFESKPIYVLTEEILENIDAVDYVLIAAYSGFDQIKRKLLQYGCPQDKIQLYLTKNIQLYDLGNLSDINEALVYKIYFQSEKRLNEAREYQKAYCEYETMDRRAENTGRWYEKGPLISHACGGFVDGKRCMYSNSKEALEYSFSEQFRLIECDVRGKEQDELILAHDFKRFYEAVKENYTMQNIYSVLSELRKSDASLLIDVKWSNIDEYNWYLSKIMEAIDKIGNGNKKVIDQLKKQVVMEVYEEESIKCAYKNGFDMFFTQYKNQDIDHFIQTAVLCKKYDIGAVGFGAGSIEWYQKRLNIFKNKNIKIYAFSCDSVEEYKALREMGVDGIFTNYLTYRDVRNDD